MHSTATSDTHTLSLHDALPIYTGAYQAAEALKDSMHRQVMAVELGRLCLDDERPEQAMGWYAKAIQHSRSEEHTSELQSPCNLVCRLLLEKKKIENIHKNKNYI